MLNNHVPTALIIVSIPKTVSGGLQRTREILFVVFITGFNTEDGIGRATTLCP